MIVTVFKQASLEGLCEKSQMTNELSAISEAILILTTGVALKKFDCRNLSLMRLLEVDHRMKNVIV
jgi:hypothetical protein